MRVIFTFLISLVALAPSGCTGRAGSTELAKIRQKLDEMAQEQSHHLRRIDELNNRIFLLEDKVDTSRVAMERNRPPQLPVIRLRPDPAAGSEAKEAEPVEEDEGGEDEEPDGGGLPPAQSVVEENQVAFLGAARKKGPRPVLRLTGSGDGGDNPTPRTDQTPPAPLPARGTETIPVVPMPKRKLARSLASNVVPMRDYQTALSMYKEGRVSAAASAFRSFAQKYTQHSYADNALYWLGECLYDMKNYKVALKIFRRVVEEYPTGNKAPDALLKMAYSYLKLQEKANARTVLAQLVQSFPKSEVARLASQRLVEIQ